MEFGARTPASDRGRSAAPVSSARALTDSEAESPDYELEIAVLGSRVRIRCDQADTRNLLAAEWARCSAREEDVDVLAVVEAPGAPDVPTFGYRLATNITTLAARAASGSLWVVHGCGVATDDGDVIALVGPSGSGKTTAAIALTTSEFGYVTDEAVGITPLGKVIAYPKPLSLVSEMHPSIKTQHGPDALGLRRCPADLRLRAVVLLERDNDVTTPWVESVPLIDGLLELAQLSVDVTSFSRPFIQLSTLLDACGGAKRLHYSEVSAAAGILRQLVTEEPRASVWRPAGEPYDGEDMRWGLLDGRVRRTPWTDAVIVEGEALVLLGRTPVRLSGIGLTIWQAAVDQPTLDNLVEVVVDVHGPHPEARAQVHEAVEHMVQAGVVVRGAPQRLGSLLSRSAATSTAVP